MTTSISLPAERQWNWRCRNNGFAGYTIEVSRKHDHLVRTFRSGMPLENAVEHMQAILRKQGLL